MAVINLRLVRASRPRQQRAGGREKERVKKKKKVGGEIERLMPGRRQRRTGSKNKGESEDREGREKEKVK